MSVFVKLTTHQYLRRKTDKCRLGNLHLKINTHYDFRQANAPLRGKKLLAKISDAGAKSQLFFVLLSALLVA
jgi:hypothetical protein